ncbi:MAG: glycerol kinase GlpK [Nitrospiraceae bacterium]|nr:glycerol kinase GlpK [Nitrospiraceae bacterium]
MRQRYILALDQGTTSSRSILFDQDAAIHASSAEPFEQIYPQPGWVEHDPEAIWRTQRSTAERVLTEGGVSPADIAAIGITNQRETTVVWERATGKPIHNAIVWQCRRTAGICDQLSAEGFGEEVGKRTGLVLDAYFSATKLMWLLEHVPGARERAEAGELCFGTIDTWLLFNLTGIHATDYSNASRTMLYNIHDLDWDDTILARLSIPRAVLPQVRPSSGVVAETTAFGAPIPVASLCGDQQSALFGQAAFDPGDCKNTYGTGCFVLMNTGDQPIDSNHGLVTTIAWGVDDTVEYALEGSVFIGGAVIQWLRDEMGLLSSAAESEEVAAQVPGAGGVYLVPAFVGLGAPHWDMHARGIITGLTRGSGRAHVVRAALESISFQSADVLRSMVADASAEIPRLRVDGGAAANNLLMQHQADVLGIPVVRGQVIETTALGAAFLAGLAVGFWPSRDALRGVWQADRVFEPTWEPERRDREILEWTNAIKRSRLL